MSPEQLEGHEADARSDIFSFGATLYEMLTGERAFQGASHASLITAIMSAQPAPVSNLQPMAPAALDRVVNRCLAKDPDDRWQTARDLRRELVWIQEGGSQAGAPPATVAARKPRAGLAWAAAGVFGLAAIMLAVLLFRQEKTVPPALRLQVNAPEGAVLADQYRPAISPDGEKILFSATTGDQSHLYLYNLRNGTAQPVAGVEGAGNAYWSFDSRSFLATQGGSLARVNLEGGSVQPLPLSFTAGSSSWGPGGIVTTTGRALLWVQPDGSGVTTLRTARAGDAGALAFPTLIPGSRWVMYNSVETVGAVASLASVYLVSTDGKTERTLSTVDSPAIYAAPGYVLYLRGSTLMARPLDPLSGKPRGDAVPVVDGVMPNGSFLGYFSASANGVLVYRPGMPAEAQLVWFDRAGRNLGTLGSRGTYTNPALSPDGKRLAICIQEPAAQTRDIWIFDLDRGTSSKLTFDPKDDFDPVWSPDGSRIAFSSDRKGRRNLYVKSSSGAGEEELLLESGLNKNAEDWSSDGRSLVYNQAVLGSANDLWTFSFGTRQPQPFLQTRFNEDQARFSPDGKWIAYRSSESGRVEVYVQPFATAGARGKWVVSKGGGQEPQWRADGKELFYSTPQDPARIMAVDIEEKNGAIVAGIPHALFETRLGAITRNNWIVTPDGRKFLAIVPLEQKPTTLNVILNWPSLLRK